MPALSIIVKGLFARLLYSVHGLFCGWRLADVKGSLLYWIVVVPIVLLPVEMIITVLANKTKGEWKWFCSSIFLFLCCTVPSIFMLETELMEERIQYKEDMNLTDCEVLSGDLHSNASGLSEIQGISVPLALTNDYWVLALEQLLLCVLIVGRWLLPKGDMTREQLSTLLMVYIGMASDILEFVLEGLKEPGVKCDRILVYVILAVWSSYRLFIFLCDDMNSSTTVIPLDELENGGNKQKLEDNERESMRVKLKAPRI
ncbi:transmembrane protein 26-like [Glandiceps talaboti]